MDSIFDVETRKIKQLKLNSDSASMGFLVFLKPEFVKKQKKVNGKTVTEELKVQPNQQSDVFMNSLIVHMIQLVLIYCIWVYIRCEGSECVKVFKIERAKNIDMMIARFMASMMMHINVENHIRNGLSMMKYAVNHYENFESN